MRKRLAWLVLAICLAMGTVAWAEPKVPPAPTGSIYVQDYAGVLSGETKTRINTVSTQLASKTKAQVVVVTVKTLEGSPIDEYGLTLLRQWGIGDKTLNNGVLLLVAVDERQSRIEVGYGLEGALPDAKTGQIQDTYMLPYFKKGDYDQGLLNGYLATIGEVAKEYNLTLKTDAKPIVTQQTTQKTSWWDALPWWMHLLLIAGLIGLLVVDWVFFGGMFTFLILSLFRGGRGGGGGGGGSGGGGSGGGGGSSRGW